MVTQPPGVDDPSSASGILRSGFDASRCQAGDRLAARIVSITDSGRACLQFAGFKAFSVRPFGGRPGDVVLFEVAPRTDPNGASVLAAAPRRLDQPLQLEIRQNGKAIRLHVFLKSLPLQNPGSERTASLMASRLAGLTFEAVTLQAALTLPAVRPAGAWLNRCRMRRRHAEGNATARAGLRGLASSNRESGSSVRCEALETKAAKYDRPSEPPAVPHAGGFHLGKAPVRFALQPDRRANGRSSTLPAVEAAFVLFLEHAGPVRTTIRMSGNRLAVSFAVENGDCGQCFLAALPNLKAALRPLAAYCECRIDVQPGGGAVAEEKTP